jgi:acyl-CoA synthetase (AMP-forming)/AMP-acid ligase II/1-acyl-sn-glycerol-3-phosphate acyltransferase
VLSVAKFLSLLARTLLKLRYRIKLQGDKFRPSKKGTLILANHPALIDPCILVGHLWPEAHFHAVAADFLEQNKLIRSLLSIFRTVYVPVFDYSNNSYKQHRIEQAYKQIIHLLKEGHSVLLYPAGSLKSDGEERIGGASGLHHILQQVPQADVFLVKTEGLWGSQFSRALTGRTPDVMSSFLRGLKIVLKNAFFFTPRRKVSITCQYAPRDFPRKGTRKEINTYLENWFNSQGPEPITLVSYSFYKVVLPTLYQKPQEHPVDLNLVPLKIKEAICSEIAQLAAIPIEQVHPDQDLSLDLGLDSLDRSQLALMLKESYGLLNVQVFQLSTVRSVLGLASRQIAIEEREVEEIELKTPDWFHTEGRPEANYPECQTLIEGFLKTAHRMGGWIAAVDQAIGEISYSRMKFVIILFAEYLKNVPGKRVGVLLPASVAANLVIFASQLAGKVPVMINWTLGGRNLDSIADQTGITTTVSSWKFLDQLDNADLASLDDQILNLETIKQKLSVGMKLKAVLLSLCPPSVILKYFGLDKAAGDETAVILFTSGTESLPKGVPLSHANLIQNQTAAFSLFKVLTDDAILSFLPPFHSFGFSVTGLLPLIAGWRVGFMPNPTQGRRLAAAIKRWGITAVCGAPTFLKMILRGASEDQLSSIRLIVSGAESCPEQLVQSWKELIPNFSFLEGYGITECAPILTFNPPNSQHKGVGLPLPGVEIIIVDPDTHAKLPPLKEGLILAHGPNIFSGYLSSSAASPFINTQGKRWYNTGDLGYLDEDGYLTLVGRLKRFVKIGGEMVSLAAIEMALQSFASREGWSLAPDAPSIAVCAKEESDEKTQLLLFTTFSVEKSRVNELLREAGLSNLLRISAVKEVPHIPLLGTGKINYRGLMKDA